MEKEQDVFTWKYKGILDVPLLEEELDSCLEHGGLLKSVFSGSVTVFAALITEIAAGGWIQ